MCWPLNKGWNTTAVTNFKQPMAQSGACVVVRCRNNVPIKTNLEPSLLSRLPGSKLTTPTLTWYLLQLSWDNHSATSPNPAQYEMNTELKERHCSFWVSIFIISTLWYDLSVLKDSNKGSPTLLHNGCHFYHWNGRHLMWPHAKPLRAPNYTQVVSSLLNTVLLYFFFLAHTAGKSKKE